MPGRSSAGLEATGVLRCTDKGMNANLMVQQRVRVCHGLTVREVLGSMMENGSQYSMADLRYDLKHERLEMLPPGTPAGPMPAGKERVSAPLAGQPQPPANVDEFLQFLQCQLRMEGREHTGTKLELPDADAEAMWPDVEAFVTPNLGATERWVPYHTILGVHELFLVESVHARTEWNEKQRFLAMFIFRAHCKRDLFNKAQLPQMLAKDFWKAPKEAFKPGGPMEKSILQYRKKTGAPLITSCFRIIPRRVLKDDTENLVRSITDRTQSLLEVAEQAWAVLKDGKKSGTQKMEAMSTMITEAPGCGDTWAKMLTVCIDLAYPKEKLLESQCDVGTGAVPPLRCLLSGGGSGDRVKDLKELLKVVNSAESQHAKQFWNCLKKAETAIRSKYKHLPLVCAQARTKDKAMTACTLQVQLCEYRQFRHSLARLKYGFGDDETMRGEAERETRLAPENFIAFDEKSKAVSFTIPKGEEKVEFSVPIKATGGNKKVAGRVAAICFVMLRDGGSKKDAETRRDELLTGYRQGADVPDNSEAWEQCKINLLHPSPLVSFNVDSKDGSTTTRFQTTQAAAGGVLEAERIARLCWVKLRAGAKKEPVIDFRNGLYKKRSSPDGVPVESPAKKRKY